MAYAVDFVLDVMKGLSSSKPVLFQRDGSLYVASAEGFGQITYGLNTTPEKIQSWEKRGQPPEIAESEDAIHRWVGNGWNKKPAFKKSEKPYLNAIAFGSDSKSFTLEEITKAAQELAELSDGKIRMVSHWSGYHSHKHGYVADGIDAGVLEARVMDRNRYLELIRENEDKLLQSIKDLGQITEPENFHKAYSKLTFPDCVILTPYMMVSLPRVGRLHLHRDEPDSWKQNTRLGSNYDGSTRGSILNHFYIDTSNESPYNISVKLNAQDLRTANAGYEVSERINEELDAVTSNMAIAEEFISKINKIHNDEVSAQDIKRRKRLKRA
jgi:hypothetical protein